VVFRVPALGNTDMALDFDDDLSSLGVNSFDYIRMVRALELIPPLCLENANTVRSTFHSQPANELQGLSHWLSSSLAGYSFLL
jgi:hypothetical protein